MTTSATTAGATNDVRTRTIGMVGLGSLGLVIAANLMARGHRLQGYRRSSLSDFVALGGVPAASPGATADRADLVMTCLPTPEALEEVVTGKGGLMDRAGAPPPLVEMSTFEIGLKTRLAEAYAARGGVMLDCPISGIPSAVAARKGLMLASGDEADFERVAPVLRDVMDRVVYCGPFGHGLKVKYVANFLVGVHTLAAIEAVALAEILGLDPGFVVETLTGSAASSVQLEARGPGMARREKTRPLGTPRNLLKDLRIIDRLAKAGGLSGNLVAAAIPTYETAVATGFGDEDVSRMIEFIHPNPRKDRQ